MSTEIEQKKEIIALRKRVAQLEHQLTELKESSSFSVVAEIIKERDDYKELVEKRKCCGNCEHEELSIYRYPDDGLEGIENNCQHSSIKIDGVPCQYWEERK